ACPKLYRLHGTLLVLSILLDCYYLRCGRWSSRCLKRQPGHSGKTAIRLTVRAGTCGRWGTEPIALVGQTQYAEFSEQREEPIGRANITGDLRPQFIRAREFLLSAQTLPETEFDPARRELFIEIKQVGFEG